MTLPGDVHTLAGRLATFEQPHHLKKRRASSSTKKKATTTTSTVTWPHKTPTPEALARAGFFYKPSSTNPDNVTCFICESSLDGWEPFDEPASEHLQHSKSCGWAIYADIGLRLDDPNRQEVDPSSDEMIEARKMTFRDQWPHDSKKGWKCKTTKMVDAGWCYDPTPDADDAVTCFYCGLALDGWEPKDDPLEEHRRRSPSCYFFNQPHPSTTTTLKASQGKKGRASRSSKTSRLSTQSHTTSFSEAPSFMSLGEPPAMDDSVLTTDTTATNTSTASKGGKKGRKATATTKKTKKATKASGGAKATISIDDRIPDTLRPSVQGLLGPSPTPEPEQPKPKRTRRGQAESASQATVEDPSEIDHPPKKGRVQRSKPAKLESRLSDDQSQLHSELQAALEASLMAHEKDNTPRGKKRTSEGVEKSQNRCISVAPDTAIKGDSAQPESVEEMDIGAKTNALSQVDNSLDASLLAKPKPKAGAKGRKGKKTSNNAPEPSLVNTSQSNEDNTVIRHDIASDVIMSDAEIGEPEQQQMAEELPQRLASPPPRQPTTSISPQSSDAENHPPSSKVKSVQQPPPVLSPTKGQGQTVRLPLAIATPAPSPSKRNIINGRLFSTYPWQAADLETVFLGSPDKENLSLTDALRTAGAELTSPEKKMTVEEWIKSNASKGEEKLRRDCERMVGIFETEGMKALKSLEGIQCI
ncbi:MAG: hypothetical protein M1821_002747 [Bathelium mastoideum]|nr:MAG: hypothetical protein M1821_002747 [Bathelium mastoideum]